MYRSGIMEICMGSDHLDREVSVSAKATPTSIEAKVKSRAIAAFDRLVGSLFDRWGAPLEGDAARERARSEGEIAIIKTVQAQVVKRLETDPDFADKTIENFCDTAVRRYENKSEVVREAFKSLEHEPPSAEQTSSGPDILDESFLNRFERYAEEASTEELRVKWGKVLAAEVKKPGTFSTKVMRIVDELEPSTAHLFERICKYRIDRTILVCLAGNLQFTEEAALIAAGLLVDSRMGIGQEFSYKKDSNGTELWYARIGKLGISIPKNTVIDVPHSGNYTIQPIRLTNGIPSIPVYALTDAGLAIASILEDMQEETLCSYIKCLSQFLPSVPVSEYRQVNDKMHCVKMWQDGTAIV